MTGRAVAPDRLSQPAKWLLASNLITNIGNGMHTITVGTLLYQKTGSAGAFGLVIVAEYVTNFLLQVLAGSVVDRGNPKALCLWADLLRGLFICLAAFGITKGHVEWWLLATTLVINIAKPFYRSATFAVGPAVASGEELTRFNALTGSFLQAGQLIGVALVGPVIQYVGPGVAFGFNGLSYLVAGLAVWVARIPAVEVKLRGRGTWVVNVWEDWKEMGGLLRSNVALASHVVLCAGDFLAVNFVNLMLVPMIAVRHGGHGYWLSIFDGSFAVGAMLTATVTARIVRNVNLRNAAVAGITLQGALFVLLSQVRSPYLSACIMAAMGAMNTFSLSIFLTHLQRRSHGPIKGRIAGLRHLTLSVMAGLLIPAVTRGHAVSLEWGMWVSAAICVGFGLVTFVLGRRWAFGGALLGLEEASIQTDCTRPNRQRPAGQQKGQQSP